MYIVKLFKEINLWRKIRKIAKENERVLNKKGFRVDWVGRIYTVINLPEEVATAPISQEGYVLMELRKHDKFLLELGIADYVSPEFGRIEGEDSFLLILSADREQLKFIPFMKSILKTTGILLILRLLYVIVSNNQEIIIQTWNKLMNLIF